MCNQRQIKRACFWIQSNATWLYLIGAALALMALSIAGLNWSCSCPPPDRSWIVDFLCRASATDFLLAWFTFFILCTAAWQGFQLKRTVDSSESANAPYIFPELSSIHVHNGNTNTPNVQITLVNFGKTPAKVLQSKFELHLEHDMDGKPHFSGREQSLPTEIIAAETRGRTSRPVTFDRLLTQDEVNRFEKTRLTDPRALRFFLTGEIVYEDFFGNTITQRCVQKIFRDNTYMVKHYVGHSEMASAKTAEIRAGLVSEPNDG